MMLLYEESATQEYFYGTRWNDVRLDGNQRILTILVRSFRKISVALGLASDDDRVK
jgi:hypothetical protein